MSDASYVRVWDQVRRTMAASAASNEIQQAASGKASVLASSSGASGGEQRSWRESGQFIVTKTAGVVILDGGKVFWDHSANAATFRKVSDRDFYLGRAVGDAASADVSMTVNLNVDPPYDIDLARDPFSTTLVGTQALGGFALLRRGGAHEFILNATSEAQKADALSVDGFAVGANAIVEFAFRVLSDGAGTVVDVSVGVASGTHATDADSIAEHCLMHLDANNTNINFQSKDGTTTVAATDSTKDYTEGALLGQRVEVWMDFRNPADPQIYVDGVNVLPASVFNMNAGSGPWFLLAHVEKTSATDTYQFALDWLRARFAEQ